MTAAVARLPDVLLLVGQLNYSWTNTESLLIHLIAGLARVDKETAIVIFLTLNTSKARIDLVERLAKLQRTPLDLRVAVLSATNGSRDIRGCATVTATASIPSMKPVRTARRS